MADVEETLKRISSHKGVLGALIVNAQGIPIRSTLSDEETFAHAALITQLVDKARRMVLDLDKDDELTFLRIRSNKHEILVAPDKEYLLICVQAAGSQVDS
ncbi:dynein light chain roadblock-type 2 [Pavlovales sp. CCMP2436]|nr:dynein light chain roadblock-type 2 [Pavlovales sp. CCMP2436]